MIKEDFGQRGNRDTDIWSDTDVYFSFPSLVGVSEKVERWDKKCRFSSKTFLEFLEYSYKILKIKPNLLIIVIYQDQLI